LDSWKSAHPPKVPNRRPPQGPNVPESLSLAAGAPGAVDSSCRSSRNSLGVRPAIFRKTFEKCSWVLKNRPACPPAQCSACRPQEAFCAFNPFPQDIRMRAQSGRHREQGREMMRRHLGSPGQRRETDVPTAVGANVYQHSVGVFLGTPRPTFRLVTIQTRTLRWVGVTPVQFRGGSLAAPVPECTTSSHRQHAIHRLAAWETAKLSSNIWKRVISPPET
jgi:hypothetical protein